MTNRGPNASDYGCAMTPEQELDLPDEKLQQLQQLAEENGLTVSEYVQQVVHSHLTKTKQAVGLNVVAKNGPRNLPLPGTTTTRLHGDTNE